MMFENIKRFHFIGIGGAGMSAIAWVLLKKGFRVQGSDMAENVLTMKLRDNGAEVNIGHRGSNIGDAQAVVVSSAIKDDNPELKAARAKGMPVFHRSEVLGAIMNKGVSAAIAGTHGKTTTTSMLALLLERCGCSPTFLIGGELNDFGGNAQLGTGKHVIAEIDESDGSLLNIFPHYAIVTNVESDHLDYYENFDKIVETFSRFVGNIREEGCLLINRDDTGAQEIEIKPGLRTLSYSVKSSDVDVWASEITLSDLGSRFMFHFPGYYEGSVTLSVPELHNVSNALPCLAVALLEGVKGETAASAMETFKGAQRRFEVKGSVQNIRVIDDYAHHPTEVRSVMDSATRLKHSRRGKIIVVFQPHRYSRTLHLGRQFGAAFHGADCVIVTDIYSAGEAPIANVTGEIIYNSVRDNEQSEVEYISQKEDIVEYVLPKLKPNDLVLTIGAGDIFRVGEEILRRLRETQNG